MTFGRAILVAVAAIVATLAPAGGSALAAVPLPDGRAWEMVSPLDKNGGDILGMRGSGGGGVAQASTNGEAVTYVAESAFAEPEGASAGEFMSTRQGAAGWATRSITIPTIAGTSGLAGQGTLYKAFSADLSLGLVLNGAFTAGEAGIENPPLPVPEGEPEAPPGYQNFYLRDDIDGSVRPLLTYVPQHPPSEFYMHFEGAAPDLRHVVVANDAALTEGAVEQGYKANLYEWAGAAPSAAEVVLSPVNVLPGDGEKTTPGATLGSGVGESHTVSDDGSRVFWSDEGTKSLYVRENGATTVQLDAPQRGPVVAGETPASLFQTASSDGSAAFFTSHEPLTEGANTGPPCGACERRGDDLYRFDVTSGVLGDLSADPGDPNGAEVQGVLGASEDGSYVYFVAKGVLAGTNEAGLAPVLGADNLYVWQEGSGANATTRFVGALSKRDANDWSSAVVHRTARVAPGGQVVFVSNMSLTGYDNLDARTGLPDAEVYLYDSRSSRLSCASCNPSGARPTGPASIPAGTPYEFNELGGALYQSRVLSDSGARVFFDSPDALVPQDTNNQQDVYEYENGHVYLLSGGTSSEGSEFVDASPSGDDVFFLTGQELVRGDTDQLGDLYDARVGGGIAEPVSPSPCEGAGCRPALPPAPVFGVGTSATFMGSGNLAPPASQPGSKPRAKAKAKRKTKKKTRRRAKRRAANGKKGGR